MNAVGSELYAAAVPPRALCPPVNRPAPRQAYRKLKLLDWLCEGLLACRDDRRWQWVFSQPNRWRAPQTGEEGRHHLHETVLQRAVMEAVAQAGIARHVGGHSSVHCSATPGWKPAKTRTLQEPAGHKHVSIPMIYTHVLNKCGHGVKGPIDGLRSGLFGLHNTRTGG